MKKVFNGIEDGALMMVESKNCSRASNQMYINVHVLLFGWPPLKQPSRGPAGRQVELQMQARGWMAGLRNHNFKTERSLPPSGSTGSRDDLMGEKVAGR